MQVVRDKAAEAGMPVKLWLDTQFDTFFENGWI
jgi:hypothetical protein